MMTMRIDHIWNLQTSSYRRCLRVTLLLVLIQLFAVSPLWAGDNEDKIVIPPLKIEPGTTQQLAIQLINNEEYTAFQAEIFFPEGITPVMTDGKCNVTLSSRKADHTISSNIISSGALKVVCLSMMNNESLKGNSGDLFYIDITSDATFEGPATIDVKGILFTQTKDRKEIAFADASGVVDTHLVWGDVNSDGVVDVGDAVSMINYIMGNPSESFNPLLADLNDDGEVDIFDVILDINLMLNNKTEVRNKTRASEEREEAFVTANNNCIQFGINDANRFTAFQFDMEVASDMELMGVRLKDNTSNHALYFIKNGQNSYRVAGVSMDNSTLSANGNDLVELSFSKAGNVHISDIIFVTPQESKTHFNCGNTVVTGIGINEQEHQAGEVFDLSGHKNGANLNRLPKGIYIINNKKIIVK